MSREEDSGWMRLKIEQEDVVEERLGWSSMCLLCYFRLDSKWGFVFFLFAMLRGYIDIRYSDDQFFDVFDLQRKVQSHHGPFSFSIGIHGMVRNISAIFEDFRGKRKK